MPRRHKNGHARPFKTIPLLEWRDTKCGRFARQGEGRGSQGRTLYRRNRVSGRTDRMSRLLNWPLNFVWDDSEIVCIIVS